MKASILALALLCTLTLAARAAPNDGIVGAYARVEVGRSNFGLSSTLPQVASNEHGQAVKLFGGYPFNENLGVEVGYAALGSFTKSVMVAGASVKQDGTARSVFGVATGRMPVADSFALHGRLGLSFGKVSGTNLLFGAPNELTLALMMGAAWVANLAIAEWLIHTRQSDAKGAAQTRSTVPTSAIPQCELQKTCPQQFC